MFFFAILCQDIPLNELALGEKKDLRWNKQIKRRDWIVAISLVNQILIIMVNLAISLFRAVLVRAQNPCFFCLSIEEILDAFGEKLPSAQKSSSKPI